MYKIEIVWYEFQYILTNNFVFDIFQLRFRFFFFIIPRSRRSSSKQKISIRVPHFRFGFDANLRELYDDHMLQRQEASRGGALSVQDIETRFDSLIFFLFLLFRKKTLSFDLIQLITMSTCLLIKSPIHSLSLSLSTLPDQFLEELSMSISDIRRQIFIYIYIFIYIFFFFFVSRSMLPRSKRVIENQRGSQ